MFIRKPIHVVMWVQILFGVFIKIIWKQLSLCELHAQIQATRQDVHFPANDEVVFELVHRVGRKNILESLQVLLLK